ncbi:hypothetical protein [Haloarchaeobius sp. DFWS5]|uniref:hypothetical protein n=1 Tax=Haloarchaeobius sp. DFWS5 TaxID=3446114 RepID=UPI003EBB8FBC
MPNPLFSTYTQGENRVTSTMMAVMAHINSRLVEDIFEGALDESDLALLTFDNQVTGPESVPDAAIRSSTSLWFETKTSENVVDASQLRGHLSRLDEEESSSQRLIVLTPDHTRPSPVDNLDDERVVWTNFDAIVDSVEEVLDRDMGAEHSVAVPTEREAFLLREFVRFLYDESLTTGEENRVLVVAARRAWDEFQQYGHYFCQPNRSFKPVGHLAFYRKNEIKTTVPRVTGSVESIALTVDAVEGADELSESQRSSLRTAVEQMEQDDHERIGREEKVLFLDEEQGFTLDEAVTNDKTADDSDRRIAFVFGHRYVSKSKLQDNPSRTSELED